MVQELYLNGHLIKVSTYKEVRSNESFVIIVDFDVTSEEYHEIATLLYNGNFEINVPKRDLIMTVAIQQYWTSLTNLYKKGQVGHYHLKLREVKK